MLKKIFVLLILLLPVYNCYSQRSCVPGDNCGYWLNSSYSFETVSPTIQTDTLNHRNQWQIAIPHKMILDSALSPTHALITDSINPILINDTSIVTLKIYPSYYYTYLQFHHKYDIDSLHQKAYLECSYNNGNSWILMDNGFSSSSCDAANKFWTCGNSDSTQDGPYFTGTTHQWKTSGYYWLWYFEERTEDSITCKIPPDSFLVRFVFQNDSVSVTHEGWMIDDIEIYNVEGCGGVNTLAKDEPAIYPNPADNYITIKNAGQIKYVAITNLIGQPLINIKPLNAVNEHIDISKLRPGLYFIQYTNSKGERFNQKFIKQ